jgi:hypothetical protein
MNFQQPAGENADGGAWVRTRRTFWKNFPEYAYRPVVVARTKTGLPLQCRRGPAWVAVGAEASRPLPYELVGEPF